MPTDENKTKVTILTGTYRVKGYIDLLPGARVPRAIARRAVFPRISGRYFGSEA